MKHDLNEIAARMRRAPVLVLDTETDGLDWRVNHTVGYVLTFSLQPEDSIYLPIRHGGGGNLDPDRALAMLRVELARPDLRIVGHNLAFDLKMMHNDGVVTRGPLEDTMINAFLLNEHQPGFSLDTCCRVAQVQAKKGDAMYRRLADLFGGEPNKDQMANFWRTSGEDPIAVDYATGDGTSTWQLWDNQQVGLDTAYDDRGRNLRNIWSIECRVIRVLHRMMVRGIRVDAERLEYVTQLIRRRLDALMAKLPSGFNPRAPSQLVKFFTDRGITDFPRLPPTAAMVKKGITVGNPSFDEGWLMRSEPGRDIVAVRKLLMLDNSFLTPMKEKHLWNGRVHANYNQTMGEQFGTKTGRLSCNDPNLQQVHKRNELLGSLFRSIFVPDPGMNFASADYNQIEPRLLAHYGEVRALIRGYLSTPPIDAHSAVAQVAGIDRQSGKTLNQALLTGAGERKAALMLGRPMEEANRIVAQYFAGMPEIKPLQRQASNAMIARGYVVSLLGRLARTEGHQFAYKAVNRLLQCGNADIIKDTMADVDEFLASEGDTVSLLNNIHDDLAYQFPEDLRSTYERCLEMMVEKYGPEPHRKVYLRVPLAVEAKDGPDWAVATYGIEKVRKAFIEMGGDYDAMSGQKVAA